MFEIGDRKVGGEHPTFIIAEAGSNHNGDLETAKKLIDKAAEAGADAVKFQIFRADKLVIDDSNNEESAYETVSDLEVPYEWIPKLYSYCKSKNIYFMATPFDEESAEKLAEYVPAFKVASVALSHYPLLEELSSFDLPIILSTGAHDFSEVKDAVGFLEEKVEDYGLLHCVSSYPTSIEDINVKAVSTLKEEFDTISGLSDHTVEPSMAPVLSIALGGSIVEKHFTLDKSMDGPDHSFALNPRELNEMVSSIRDAEKAMGDGSISISDEEEGAHKRARRSIFAIKTIEKGQVINENMIEVLRPGYSGKKGLSPEKKDDLVGARAENVIEEGEPINKEDVRFP